MPDLRDFLAESISEFQSGVEQRIYTVDISKDAQQFVSALVEYFVSCWLSPVYGDRDEVWEKWNTPSHPDRANMLDYLRNAFCSQNGEVADHPDPKRGLTKAKGNFAETLLRWVEETYREGEKRLISPVPQPADRGFTDLVEIIFHQGNEWFSIIWESKATEVNISGVASDAYKQLDDYPNRMFFILNDRAASLKEDGVGNA